MIAGPGALLDPADNFRRDPVGLVASAGKRLEPDRGCVGHRSLRSQSLQDPSPDLQAVRVVMADQSVRRIEYRCEGAVVPPEHDQPGTPISLAEFEDVADRRPPEPVD